MDASMTKHARRAISTGSGAGAEPPFRNKEPLFFSAPFFPSLSFCAETTQKGRARKARELIGCNASARLAACRHAHGAI